MIEFEKFEETSIKKGIDITPMLDMIFILLIFFLLTASVTNPVVTVELPEVEVTSKKEDFKIIISIQKDGSILINKKKIKSINLFTELENNYLNNIDDEVFIESDKEVPFGIVLNVMDDCKKKGIKNIYFLVEKKISEGNI